MRDKYVPPSFDAPIDLDLSRNEGRPSIRMLEMDPERIGALTSRYPRTESLRAVIANRHGVEPDRVLVTAGGDDALFRCFLSTSGGAVVSTTPTFEMIRRYARQVDAPLVEVPWWDGDFPISEFVEDTSGNPEMAIVVSPNNPTGRVIGAADLRKISDAFPRVVLDAAYMEFADEDLTDLVLESENIVMIRTLSKAFGLAGLRVGYLLASAETVEELSAYGSPYSMSSLSAALAADVLDTHSPDGFVSEVRAERARLATELRELGAAPIESQANFVLATEVEPDWVIPALASLGIGVRRFPDRPELGRCVRFGLPGDDDEFGRLIEAVRSVLRPEAILFDMDGVLADVRQSFRQAIVDTASHFGVTVTQDQITAAKASGDAADDWDLTRRLCAAAGVELSLTEVTGEFERRYQGSNGEPGLKSRERLLADPDLLRRLRKQYALGVVTARPRKDAEEFLARFELTEIFDTVVAREDAPSKPDPAPVRLALERLGVSRAWMLGDTVDDLAAARGAGLVPIGVTVPGEDPKTLAAAARVIESVNELERIINDTQN